MWWKTWELEGKQWGPRSDSHYLFARSQTSLLLKTRVRVRVGAQNTTQSLRASVKPTRLSSLPLSLCPCWSVSLQWDIGFWIPFPSLLCPAFIRGEKVIYLEGVGTHGQVCSCWPLYPQKILSCYRCRMVGIFCLYKSRLFIFLASFFIHKQGKIPPLLQNVPYHLI